MPSPLTTITAVDVRNIHRTNDLRADGHRVLWRGLCRGEQSWFLHQGALLPGLDLREDWVLTLMLHWFDVANETDCLGDSE